MTHMCLPYWAAQQRLKPAHVKLAACMWVQLLQQVHHTEGLLAVLHVGSCLPFPKHTV